jgi:class 3 adenylate cyclase
VLAQLRTLVRVNAESHGVRVTKWLGDGAMLSGIDSGDVLDCARTVVERLHVEDGPDPRAGVCEGAVIMFEGDDYIGAAVNVAARLCDAAGPRQVLVASASVPAEVLDGRARALPPLSLPGVAAPVDVCELALG